MLAALLSVSVLYIFNQVQMQNSKDLIVSEMQRSAKITSDSILITGWEETDDYLGYLTQVTSFYVTYKSFYSVEAKTYQAELDDWREYFSEKRKAKEAIFERDIALMIGLVKSSEEHLENIADKNNI